MPAQQGSINLQGKAAFVVLAVPVSALSQFDDDRDGRISNQEMAAHKLGIEDQVQRGFTLLDGEQKLQLDFIQASAESHELSETEAGVNEPLASIGAQHFLVLMKWTWTSDSPRLRLHFNLFGTASTEQQFTIKILRDQQSEVAILSPHHAEHVLFRGSTDIFKDYVVLGIEHILTGWDHLLFLFTLIIAAPFLRAWRSWLLLLTSFTVAHSITLGLSLFGLVQAPVTAVEALIMLSISWMALLNLRGQRANASALGFRVSTTTQAVIVFACGLLNGFGFASAMSAMGLDARYRGLSLFAFNLGVELGQIAFLLVVLLCFALLARRKWSAVSLSRYGLLVNGAILVLSLLVFVARLGVFN